MDPHIIMSSRKKAIRATLPLGFATTVLVITIYVILTVLKKDHTDPHLVKVECGIILLFIGAAVYSSSLLFISLYASIRVGKLTISDDGIELKLAGLTRFASWQETVDPRSNPPLSIVLGKTRILSATIFITDIWLTPLEDILALLRVFRSSVVGLDNIPAKNGKWPSITQNASYVSLALYVVGVILFIGK